MSSLFCRVIELSPLSSRLTYRLGPDSHPRPEIIPSTQISDGSVYIPSRQPDKVNNTPEPRPILSKRLARLSRPSFTSSSDGLTPALTSSSSSYRDQDRTGFSIPSTPVFFPDALDSSPGFPPTSELDPFQSSPAVMRYPSRRLGGARHGSSSSSKPPVVPTPWTGKGTLFDVLTEPGQGKTLVTCSVVRTAEFAPRRKSVMKESSSHNITQPEEPLDENDGLAALLMKEADEAEGSGDEENHVGSRDTSTGWGLLVEIKLRNLGRPVSLEQTSRLRTAVFGEKSRPGSYRRVETAAARKLHEVAGDSRLGRNATDMRKPRIKADRIDVKASLARKTPSQMVEVAPASSLAPGTSLGFSSLGLDSPDPDRMSTIDEIRRGLDSDALLPAASSIPQRYPAALSASSSLKRKSLAIPHDQIPRNRRGPNLVGDWKRRKTEQDERSKHRAPSPSIKLEPSSSLVNDVDKSLPSDVSSRRISPSKTAKAGDKRSLLEAIVSSSSGRICKVEPPSPEANALSTLPKSSSHPSRRESGNTGRKSAVPMSEPAISQNGSNSNRPVGSLFRPRPNMKRTLSEIAERESQRRATQTDAADDSDDLTESVSQSLANVEPIHALLQARSRAPPATLNNLFAQAEDRSIWSRNGIAWGQPLGISSLASTSNPATLPFSDDSSSSKTLQFSPREPPAAPAEQWLQAPDLDHLFGLDVHAPNNDLAPNHPSGSWEIGSSAVTLGSSNNAGFPFADEAFAFFDSTYTSDFDLPSLYSPVDFSQLPPSSPPQSESELPHSVLLMSSPPEGSGLADTPIEII